MTDFYGFAILYKNELRLLKEMKNNNRKNKREMNMNMNINKTNNLNELNETSIVLPKMHGSPTAITLCHHTKNIFIGYSGGFVEKYNTNMYNENKDNNKDKSKDKDRDIIMNKLNSRLISLPFDTSTVHACNIKKILSISLPQPITNRNQLIPTKVLVLLICDDSGIMSVWKIGDKFSNTEIR